MKKCAVQLVVVLVLAMLSGCGAAAKTIAARSASERTDVFSEVTATDAVPAGYADVTLSAEIKTHLEGYYRGESNNTAHGKKAYPFLFNINGQASVWMAAGQKHVLPNYEADGKTSRDSEAGEGMKYTLNKKIRLAEGAYQVFFGLPEEPYHMSVTVAVQAGKRYVLAFTPEYRRKTNPNRIPTFQRGIEGYRADLNGERLMVTGP